MCQVSIISCENLTDLILSERNKSKVDNKRKS